MIGNPSDDTQINLTAEGRYLLDYTANVNAALLVIDPVAAAYASNENDRSQVRRSTITLTQWAHRHSVTVLLVAHPSKSAGHTTGGLSGSTDWHGSARAVILFEPTKKGSKDNPDTPQR